MVNALKPICGDWRMMSFGRRSWRSARIIPEDISSGLKKNMGEGRVTDRDTLLKNFIDASLALMQEGLAGLSPEKAVLVDRAQRAGVDVCQVFRRDFDERVGE